MTLKSRGRSKKTEGLTKPKSKGGSLAVGTYLQRDSAPHPRVAPSLCKPAFHHPGFHRLSARGRRVGRHGTRLSEGGEMDVCVCCEG